MALDTSLRLVVLVGSTRPGRFGSKVRRWFEKVVADHGRYDVDIVDLAELALPAVIPETNDDEVTRYLRRLDDADAFVVITPEYNHGYPAGLKQAIDLAYHEWRAKPVGFVSYGGVAGGVRAVEQLRQVFAEMHAVTVRDCVSLHNPWHLFDTDDGPARTGADDAARKMLDQLAWWARALRTARAEAPYAA